MNPAGPWHGTIGPATVCRALSLEEAKKRVDASRLEGMAWIVNTITGERWLRRDGGWHPFVPVARKLRDERERRAPQHGRRWWLDDD